MGSEPPASESGKPASVPLDKLLQSFPPDEDASKPENKKPAEEKSAQEKWEDRKAAEVLRQLRLAGDKTKAEVDDHKSRTARDERDHKLIWRLRVILAIAGLLIVVLWQLWILCIVDRLGTHKMSLPEPITIALVTTTTVNVFGLLVIVLKFVFPAPPRKV
jgi:hypothetical protein